MAEIKDCAFLILAGGKSRRMGKEKAGLSIGKETFLEHMIQKGLRLGFPEILISGEPDCPLRKDLKEKVRYIPDVLTDRGPLGGLYACFLAAKSPAAFVISVDVPLLSEDTVRSLVSSHETESRTTTLLIHDGREEPLIGVYSTRNAAQLGELIAERPLSVFKYLHRTGWRTVELAEPAETISNINTPEEYESFMNERE